MYPASRLLLPLLVFCLSAACSEPALKDQVSEEFAEEKLYPVRNSGFTEAFVRRDANLAGFLRVDIQALAVKRTDISGMPLSGTLRRDWQMTPERETALQRAWADAMDRAFSAYSRESGGPGVLRITAELTRIAPGMPTATTVGGALQPAGSTQDAVEFFAKFRLYDGASDELLAVIRDSRTVTTAAMSRTAPVAVTTMFRSWAALLHTRVSGR